MDALDLIFRRLVLAARAAGALERPITVGEILESFVPYASARGDGQLASNDDYLQAVMELISGQRDLVFGDDVMQDDLKAELKSPNPDLSVVRTYAYTNVRLSTAGVQRVLADDAASTPALVPLAELVADRPTAPGRSSTIFDAFEPTPTLVEDHGCPYCAQPIPEGRTIRFCPTCGQNLLVRRCVGCSAEIESGWKFCVTCGRSAR